MEILCPLCKVSNTHIKLSPKHSDSNTIISFKCKECRLDFSLSYKLRDYEIAQKVHAIRQAGPPLERFVKVIRRKKMNFALLKSLSYYEAQRLLEDAVHKFAKEVKSIAKKYPSVGIGDTATDEAITSEVYKLIHGGDYD